MVDLNMNRGSAPSDLLPPEVSKEIWSLAIPNSAVMTYGSEIALPAAGVTVPIITGDPIATWESETDEIQASDSSISKKSLRGEKVGVIELFSNEFKRDLDGLYAALVERLPQTIGTAFDAKCFNGVATTTFDSLANSPILTLGSTTAYDDLVAIDAEIYEALGINERWLMAPKARRVLNGAKDSLGHPLILNSIQGDRNVQTLFGADVTYHRNAYKADAAGDQGEVLGFAGQFTGNMFWGSVQGITIEASAEATINRGGEQINLFQRDMFALKVTAYLGFGVKYPNQIVRVGSGVNTVA